MANMDHNIYEAMNGSIEATYKDAHIPLASSCLRQASPAASYLEGVGASVAVDLDCGHGEGV